MHAFIFVMHTLCMCVCVSTAGCAAVFKKDLFKMDGVNRGATSKVDVNVIMHYRGCRTVNM